MDAVSVDVAKLERPCASGERIAERNTRASRDGAAAFKRGNDRVEREAIAAQCKAACDGRQWNSFGIDGADGVVDGIDRARDPVRRRARTHDDVEVRRRQHAMPRAEVDAFRVDGTSRQGTAASGASVACAVNGALRALPVASSVSAASEPATPMSASVPASAASPFACNRAAIAKGAAEPIVASPVIAPTEATNVTADMR
jgi:hypothetical protein